jgi:hypothetical protein
METKRLLPLFLYSICPMFTFVVQTVAVSFFTKPCRMSPGDRATIRSLVLQFRIYSVCYHLAYIIQHIFISNNITYNRISAFTLTLLPA